MYPRTAAEMDTRQAELPIVHSELAGLTNVYQV